MGRSVRLVVLLVAVRAGELHRAERVRLGPGPGALVVGKQIEAGGDDLHEHLRAVTAPVEGHRAPALGSDHRPQLGQKPAQLGGQRRRRRGGEHHHRVAVGVADPALLGRRPGDSHPGDMRLGQLPGAGIDPDMPVEVEETDRLRSGFGVVPAQRGLQLRATPPPGKLGQFAAKRFHLRGPVQPEQPTQIGRPDPARPLRPGLTH